MLSFYAELLISRVLKNHKFDPGECKLKLVLNHTVIFFTCQYHVSFLQNQDFPFFRANARRFTAVSDQ